MSATKIPSLGKELEKTAEKIAEFDAQIKAISNDVNEVLPKLEQENQTKLSQKEINTSKEIYLKPLKSVGAREKFNEKFRADYDYSKKYVRVIAEHKEIVGSTIDCWTKKWPGTPAEFWKIPTNKPVWMPRYLAEHIKSKFYKKLVMEEKPTESAHEGQYFGRLVAEHIVQRLDCFVAPEVTTVSMRNRNF